MIDPGPALEAVRVLARVASEQPYRRDLVERARADVETAVADLDDAVQAGSDRWDGGADLPVARRRPDGYGATVHIRARAGRHRKLHRALVAELAACTGESPAELRSRDGHELLTELLHLATSELAERLDHAVDVEMVGR